MGALGREQAELNLRFYEGSGDFDPSSRLKFVAAIASWHRLIEISFDGMPVRFVYALIARDSKIGTLSDCPIPSPINWARHVLHRVSESIVSCAPGYRS